MTAQDIYDYLNEIAGCTDYNDKVECLIEDLDLDEETAESFVWSWASGLYLID